MPEAEVGLQPDPQPDQERPLHHQLQNAAGHHAHHQCQDRLPEKIPQRQRRQDHGKVEDDRGECRRREMAERIQDAHAEGHQRDEKDVGKHQAVEENRELVLDGHPGEARGHGGDDERREDHAGNGDGNQDNGEEREGDAGQLEGLLARFPVQVLGEDGYEGNGEGSFAEKPPQQVGNPEGDEKSVGHDPGAEETGHHHVPNEPEDPAQHRGQAHDARGLGDLRVFPAVRTLILHRGNFPEWRVKCRRGSGRRP